MAVAHDVAAIAAGKPKPKGQPLPPLSEFLRIWPLVEADFHSEYGADLSALKHERTYRWFLVRLIGLLSTESRVQRVLRPVKASTARGRDPVTQ